MNKNTAESAQTTIRVRRCQSEDFEQVLRLLRQLWPNQELDPNLVRGVFNRALASDRQVYLCALVEQQVVGFGSLSIKNNLWQQGYLAQVDELVVEEKHRSRGMGTRLLAHLIDLARQRHCRRIELDSAFHRDQAHRFYEAQGFTKRAFLFTQAL